METMIQTLGTFFLYALLAVFAQNAVFSRGLGISRLIRLVNDDAIGTFQFWLLLASVEVITMPLGYLTLNYVLLPMSLTARAALRPLVYLACAFLAYLLVTAVLLVVQPKRKDDLLRILPMATFNTSVLGTLLICGTQGYDLVQYLGFGVGTAVGYLMAVLLVDEAERRLKDSAVPVIFRGMPITLIYIGILALAIYGFTGHSLTL